jgi:hypothetical protein
MSDPWADGGDLWAQGKLPTPQAAAAPKAASSGGGHADGVGLVLYDLEIGFR